MSDIYKVKPISYPVKGIVQVPGSKSITNRALPIAALADGECRLSHVLFSDDSRHFINCLKTLGFQMNVDEPNKEVRIQGQNGYISGNGDEVVDLFVGNAGTAARFLTACLAIGDGVYRVDGIPRMRERPIQDLIDALRMLGVSIEDELQTGCPPVRIRGGKLPGGKTRVKGNKSSQYLSGLLLVAPYASSDVTIEIDGELIAKPYVHMTIEMMKAFGVEVENRDDQAFFIRAGQRYQARTYAIEPDASNASYFLAAAAITGGTITIENLGKNSLQGDAGFAYVLERMGCQVSLTNDSVTVTGPQDGKLQGIDIDLNEMSDMTQTLAAIAPFASTPVTIRNIGHIRLQETDRIKALATELGKLGQTVHEYPDALRIEPAPIRPNVEIDTYDDHRMAMSFAILGLCADGLVLRDPMCVRKTFPTYYEVLETLY
ncbi:3-phosphoshikimate 1-carboxyvinyltransferase [Fodinisporobacter ferrooxydans]|uniref:3-phosphoshikimate 1-carboxyvinyltransferase n=1 Tax=Fodinisporobacter ferrooxydans TaxID=2901836 RepID=A0ABY4CLZ5_9BACL|nr:3-phosphoshikimate 1-carboxyvinyltransferase [Alicyclobacillaceae bacterium MYW30-H2]